MSTYRERREARAERLRGWAEKREARADAGYQAAQTKADVIPFSQPILVGHHSERRDRNYRAGITRQFERSFEDAEKARSMNSRAANIEAQIDSSIYSDDEDAVPRLQAKLEGLLATRKRYTDYNASCRKALKTDPASTHGDMDLLDEAQRRSIETLARVRMLRPGGAFPSYATSNLSGQISQIRARIERLTRTSG